MGGKSFFCDYCRCFMKNDINVRKTHNAGLAHKIKKVSYMRKYEDPRKVYFEEKSKIPCTRYMKGYCKFDLFCQFTHYNDHQLEQLKLVVVNMSQKKLPKSTIQTLPEFGGIPKNILKQLPKKLPASLKPLNFRRISKLNIRDHTWG